MAISSSLKTFAAIAVTFIGMGAFSQTADAASQRHIDRLAVSFQAQARVLMHEFRLHYRHTSQYRHLMSDARDLYYRAAHIHELVHHHGSLHHIERDINKMDTLFHHLEDLVDHIEIHPHGHIHGHTGHVARLMARMEDTLHHLQEDVEEMLDPHHGHHPVPVIVHPGHGHGHGHKVIRFGNDKFSIRFGF